MGKAISQIIVLKNNFKPLKYIVNKSITIYNKNRKNHVYIMDKRYNKFFNSSKIVNTLNNILINKPPKYLTNIRVNMFQLPASEHQTVEQHQINIGFNNLPIIK